MSKKKKNRAPAQKRPAAEVKQPIAPEASEAENQAADLPLGEEAETDKALDELLEQMNQLLKELEEMAPAETPENGAQAAEAPSVEAAAPTANDAPSAPAETPAAEAAAPDAAAETADEPAEPVPAEILPTPPASVASTAAKKKKRKGRKAAEAEALSTVGTKLVNVLSQVLADAEAKAAAGPQIYVGPNDDISFRDTVDVYAMPIEPIPSISEAGLYMGRRTPPVLNNSAVLLNRMECNLGKSKKMDRFLVMDRYCVEEYGFLSRIPLKYIWRIAHGEEANALLKERAACKKKGRRRGYGLKNADYPLNHEYTEVQWNADLERVCRFVESRRTEDRTGPVCLEEIWLLSEMDFQTAFLHRSSNAIKLMQLAMLAEARQNQHLESVWGKIRKYLYKVPLERKQGGIFSDADAEILRASGIRYLNDIRKYTPYEIKNLLIDHEMGHIVEQLNAAFKEDLARRRDRRLRYMPFISGFVNLTAAAVVAYIYQYTLIKNQLMTWIIMGLLGLWAVTIPTIIIAAIRAVHRRKTRRKGYYYFIRPVRNACKVYALAAIFVLLSCTLFYERYDGYDKNYFYRDLDDGGIAIAGRFNDKLIDCRIPDSIDGKTVTEIDLFAFFGDNITGVTLPESVKTVDRGAFLNCDFLRKVSLNTGLTTMNRHAFRGCTRLKELVLPDTLEILGNDVFRESGILSVDLTATAVTSIPDGAYRGCEKLTSFVGLEKVTEIGNNAFNGCLQLQDVELSQSLKTIGDGAFNRCNAFRSITVPNSVTYIGKHAFDYCQNVVTLNIPYLGHTPEEAAQGSLKDVMKYDSKKKGITLTVTGKTLIGEHSFDGFNWCSAIHLGDGVTEIHDNAFRDLSFLKTVSIPKHVIEIGANAFYGCTKLQEIIGAEDVELLGDNAFRECSSLTTVTLPALKTIGNGAFMDCKKLTEVVGLEQATEIGSSAFRACVKLTDVTFSNSLKTIGANAFRGCTLFKNVTVPVSVTTIGQGAFRDLPNLETISVPFTGTTLENSNYRSLTGMVSCGDSNRKLTVEITAMKTVNRGSLRGADGIATLTLSACDTLGKNACKELSLMSVYLPGGIKTISDGAFDGCIKLQSVKDANSVAKIGKNAFRGCSRLTDFEGLISVTEIGDRAFLGCKLLPNVTFSSSLKTIGREAFRGCISFTEVTVPASTTLVGKKAFADITKLTSITVPFTGTTLKSSNRESLSDIFYCDDSAKSITVTVTVMTDLSAESFKDCASVRDLRIASPMTAIADSAFQGMNLRSITLPASVTSLGAYAFADCKSLTEINGMDSITVMGEGAFQNVSQLTAIDLSRVKTIGNNCFEGCSSLSNVETLRSIENIGAYAFKDCPNLVTVMFESQLNTLSDYAFAESSLQYVSLPDTLHTIGNGAFRDCVSLVDVTLPGSVKTLGDEAFRNCDALYGLDLSTTAINKIGTYAFADCAKLSTLILPVTVTQIPDGMASNSEYLEDVTLVSLPLISIGASAFANTSVYGNHLVLPESLLTIGEKAFAGCEFEEITLPKGLASVGKDAFSDCSDLKTATLPFVGATPSDVSKGYTHVFGNSRVKDVTVTAMKTVENDSFNGAALILNSLTLGEGTTTIEKGAFKGFLFLNSVSLPDTLTTMGVGAFETCTALTYIHIPASLTIIPADAFNGCTSLKEIDFNDMGLLNTIEKNAFSTCTSLKAVTFPEGLVTVESNAFGACLALRDITFSESMTMVNKNAFKGCLFAKYDIPESIAALYEGQFGQ